LPTAIRGDAQRAEMVRVQIRHRAADRVRLPHRHATAANVVILGHLRRDGLRTTLTDVAHGVGRCHDESIPVSQRSSEIRRRECCACQPHLQRAGVRDDGDGIHPAWPGQSIRCAPGQWNCPGRHPGWRTDRNHRRSDVARDSERCSAPLVQAVRRRHLDRARERRAGVEPVAPRIRPAQRDVRREHAAAGPRRETHVLQPVAPVSDARRHFNRAGKRVTRIEVEMRQAREQNGRGREACTQLEKDIYSSVREECGQIYQIEL